MYLNNCKQCYQDFEAPEIDTSLCSMKCLADWQWSQRALGKLPPRKERTDDNHGPGEDWLNKKPIEEQERIRKAMSDSKLGSVPWNKGRSFSEESRRKMSESAKLRKRNPKKI